MVPLVISAIAAGADMKVIAAGSKTLQEAPHMKYFVRKDSGIRTPRDLEGKTIGFNSFGACAEFVSRPISASTAPTSTRSTSWSFPTTRASRP